MPAWPIGLCRHWHRCLLDRSTAGLRFVASRNVGALLLHASSSTKSCSSLPSFRHWNADFGRVVSANRFARILHTMAPHRPSQTPCTGSSHAARGIRRGIRPTRGRPGKCSGAASCRPGQRDPSGLSRWPPDVRHRSRARDEPSAGLADRPQLKSAEFDRCVLAHQSLEYCFGNS